MPRHIILKCHDGRWYPVGVSVMTEDGHGYLSCSTSEGKPAADGYATKEEAVEAYRPRLEEAVRHVAEIQARRAAEPAAAYYRMDDMASQDGSEQMTLL